MCILAAMVRETDGAGPSGFDPTQPLLTWLSAVQERSRTAWGSVEHVTSLTQAQWGLVRSALALMAEVPLSAVEDGTRELARLREALHAVQLQTALVDSQLATLEEVMQPVQDWAKAWRSFTAEVAPGSR